MTSKNTDLLVKKLGLSSAKDAIILHPPVEYTLPNTKASADLNDLGPSISWVQAFYGLETSLAHDLPAIEEKLTSDGCIWVCWPKRSANKNTDLSDTVVRSIGLACGLVDVKVVSIDKTWSGLKFVYRTEDR